jgi:peptidoglycan hydrolase-like protein with peptidoglycan-binding domain
MTDILAGPSIFSGLQTFLGDDVVLGPIDDLYLSWDEAPDDEIAEEGDNAELANAPWANPGAPTSNESIAEIVTLTGVHKVAAKPQRRAAIVPHPRDLRYRASGGYMRGPDVTGLDRALWRAGVYKHAKGTPFRKAFGPGMRDHVKKFQKKRGLKVDGVYGLTTHRALARWYDSYAIKLVNSYQKPSTPAQRLNSAAMIAYNFRWKIHYTQSPARMYLVRNKIVPARVGAQASIWEDCSSFATWLYWSAGLPDPNNLRYNGQGYTGTLANNGRRVWSKNAPIGAMSFYGGGFPYGHVTIRVAGDKIVSHGNESGPNLYNSAFYRTDLRQTRVYF